MMQPLATVWPTLAGRIHDSEAIAVATDFDGTLVPLMDRPDSVTVPERACALLSRLAARRRTSLAIVSGRSFLDLATQVPIPNTVLIANHGLEIRVPGQLLARDYDEADLGVTHAALILLEKRLNGIAGVHVEDKGPVVAVHYRRVSDGAVPRLLEIVNTVAAELGPTIRVVKESSVFEFCPRRVSGKGSALLGAWAEFGVPAGATCLYFGDDATDEDVFLALPADAVTVHVGARGDASAARYVVDTPGRVLDALEQLDDVIAARADRVVHLRDA